MTTQVCPRFLLLMNAVAALAAIGLTAYKAPTTSIYKKIFFPDNNVFNQKVIQEQLNNQPTPEKIAQCRDFKRRGGGWGNGSRYGRMYNSQTVETITGKVLTVDTFTPTSGMSHGVHLQVKTQNGTIPIHLGPAWYVDNQDIIIEPKDTVEIEGSKINFAGEAVIIAAQIKKGDMTLLLRDEDGFPLWNGWRRNQLN